MSAGFRPISLFHGLQLYYHFLHCSTLKKRKRDELTRVISQLVASSPCSLSYLPLSELEWTCWFSACLSPSLPPSSTPSLFLFLSRPSSPFPFPSPSISLIPANSPLSLPCSSACRSRRRNSKGKSDQRKHLLYTFFALLLFFGASSSDIRFCLYNLSRYK